MRKCPKCGQTFETENQEHHCIGETSPIDAYIAAQPENVQPFLNLIRNKLGAVLPNAQERVSWRMPTYWDKHNIIHFAAHKNHIGLYPGPEAIAHFSDRLKQFKTSKGAIQFPYNKHIPIELIGEIAKWCYETENRH